MPINRTLTAKLRCLYFLCCTFFFAATVLAQPQQACVPGQAIGRYCWDACIDCDLDGLQGRIELFSLDSFFRIPVQDCAGGSYNGHVRAFVAQTEFISLRVSASDCIVDDQTFLERYIQFYMFDVNNGCTEPFSFVEQTSIVPCTSRDAPPSLSMEDWSVTILEGRSKVFSNEVPLVIGQVYYLDISSTGGVTCAYEIEVLEGSTAIPELGAVEIMGDFTPCLGDLSSYTVSNPLPGTRYFFTLNGDTVGSNQTQLIWEWDTEGSYELCIHANNYCHDAPPNCQNIRIGSAGPFFVEADLCPNECYRLLPDSLVCEAGVYELPLISQRGCDSLVIVRLIARDTSLTPLAATICAGDTLRYWEEAYYLSGTYTRQLRNQYGCDSLVVLELTVRTCPLLGDISSVPVACYASADGRLAWLVTNGIPPYEYTYFRLGGGAEGGGTQASIGSLVIISGLMAGTYLVEVTDAVGNSRVFTSLLTEPPELSLSAVISSYNGFNVSCAESADGYINALASGGTPPYQWQWDSGAVQASLTNLMAGNYGLTLIDHNNCQGDTIFQITAPPVLSVSIAATSEGCEEGDLGSIELLAIEGGVSPYTWSLQIGEEEVAANQSMFSNLPASNYSLVASDLNACRIREGVIVTAPQRPQLVLQPTATFVELGQTIDIQVDGHSFETVSIASEGVVLCDNCLSYSTQAIRSASYTATAVSQQACSATASTMIGVYPNRELYVPTAFSPNEDGINDIFIPYGGLSAERILRFTIYDRWGGQVYQAIDLLPSDHQNGWDGRHKGMEAAAGMYFWEATVLFLDEQTKQFKGGVLLVR